MGINYSDGHQEHPKDLFVYQDNSTCYREDFDPDSMNHEYGVVPFEEPPRLVGKPTKPVIDWCNSDRK